MPDQPPERGVIEVKPPEDSLGPILESEQVAKYWDRYGLVLIDPDLRQWLLVRVSAYWATLAAKELAKMKVRS